jgi:hypothetical protein
LQRQGRRDGGIASVGVRLRAWLVVLKEDLANLAVLKSADRGGVSKPADFKLERFTKPSLGQPIA